MNSSLSVLCQSLGYEFSDQSLLQLALTHRSAEKKHNERLEFLGDAVLSMLVASELYARFPGAKEGELSRLRSSLVNDKRLASIAAGFDLGQYIKLGSGEQKSGGATRESILAGAVEAIIGATYLDGGYPAGRKVVLSLQTFYLPIQLELQPLQIAQYLGFLLRF